MTAALLTALHRWKENRNFLRTARGILGGAIKILICAENFPKKGSVRKPASKKSALTFVRIKKSHWFCVRCGSEFIPLKPQQLFCTLFCKVFSKVKIGANDECWTFSRPWSKGYGLVKWQGKGRFAHRVAYEHYRGPIPEGCEVCHTCDNPPCCNPAHLFIGTSQDNHDDASRKGRTTQGEKSWKAKLTDAHVRSIRSMSFEILDYKHVAELIGCNLSAVAKVYTRQTWRHLP